MEQAFKACGEAAEKSRLQPLRYSLNSYLNLSTGTAVAEADFFSSPTAGLEGLLHAAVLGAYSAVEVFAQSLKGHTLIFWENFIAKKPPGQARCKS